MLRITTHIERLLLVNDCVVIPEVGGFVFQTLPAVYRKEDHTFSVMRKELVFNKALQHQDGLLAESYVETYQVDFRKAQQMLEEDIAELKASLQQYGKVSLGNIGSISRGAEGQYMYQPGKTDAFNIDHYGLTSFHFPELPRMELQTTELLPVDRKKRKDILYLPVNRRIIRGIVSSAAAVALFLLISTPVKEINQSVYKASFIPAEMVLPKIISTPVDVEKDKEMAEEVINEVPESVTPPVVAPPPVVKAPVADISDQSAPKMYHIVIGSFPTESQAGEFLRNIDRAAFGQAGVVHRSDRYRVYARKYDNREEAETYLGTVRENEKYKDAWLFISK